jgi:predicted deacylase
MNSEVTPPPISIPTIHRAEHLDVEACPPGQITRFQIALVADGLGDDIHVPIMVARGRKPGPVFGLTAAVHGNELNGIRVIHDLFEHMEVSALKGTVVAVIAVNVPGLHWHQRQFIDGTDLNHIFPGRPGGNVAQVYAHRVVERIVKRFDYLVDLHTASFGRINSLYVRADMTQETSARMAYLLRPQIIVHNPAADSTLRGTAMDMGIPAITVEIGDPQRFQPNYIRSCRVGLRSILANVGGMLPRRVVATPQEPILCQRSYWMYTDHGGLLEVLPNAASTVQTEELVARLRSPFGDVVREYRAPERGVVVGKSVNPVGQTGARILHLGVVAPEDHQFLRRNPDDRK